MPPADNYWNSKNLKYIVSKSHDIHNFFFTINTSMLWKYACNVFHSPVIKMGVINCYVYTTLLYDAETWAMNTQLLKKKKKKDLRLLKCTYTEE